MDTCRGDYSFGHEPSVCGLRWLSEWAHLVQLYCHTVLMAVLEHSPRLLRVMNQTTLRRGGNKNNTLRLFRC